MKREELEPRMSVRYIHGETGEAMYGTVVSAGDERAVILVNGSHRTVGFDRLERADAPKPGK